MALGLGREREHVVRIVWISSKCPWAFKGDQNHFLRVLVVCSEGHQEKAGQNQKSERTAKPVSHFFSLKKRAPAMASAVPSNQLRTSVAYNDRRKARAHSTVGLGLVGRDRGDQGQDKPG